MTSSQTVAVRPSPAERARTVASRPSAAVCAAGLPGSRVLAHATTADERVLVVVPTDGELCRRLHASTDDDLASLLMVTDHAPVPLREPVRAQLWVSGWLTPLLPGDVRAAVLAFADVLPAGALLDVGRSATLLRMDLAEVVLGADGATVEVTPEDYLAAAPDPLVAVEASSLQHLDDAHPDQLALLARLIPARSLGADDVVRPLGLDRFGFRLRIERPRGHQDVRVPFAAPLTDPHQLAPAVARLLCHARSCCRRG